MTNIQIYLKLKLLAAGVVKGDAGGDHLDEILIDKYAWGCGADAAGGGTAGSSQAMRVHEFEFWTKMNRASPLIMVAAVTGDPVVEAVLASRNANAKTAQEFLKFTLTDGILAAYRTEAAAESMIPHERFTIRFRKMAVEFRPVTAEGRLGAMIAGAFDTAILAGASGQGTNTTGRGAGRGT